MITEKKSSDPGCDNCTDNTKLNFDFTMAFQPIVDVEHKRIYAHEALARGLENQSAAYVLDKIHDGNRYRFDQTCRVKAIELAAKLGMDTFLSVNFMPNAVYRPENCIRTTLQAAKKYNFPHERIIFEVTEGEKIENHAHLNDIFREYQRLGFKTAIDDFGAGYSGLNLLAKFKPDLIKIDLDLIRDIDTDEMKKAIVSSIVDFCGKIKCQVIAEGIETKAEARALREIGINLLQGYWFARPSFQSLAEVPEQAFSF